MSNTRVLEIIKKLPLSRYIVSVSPFLIKRATKTEEIKMSMRFIMSS